MKTLLAILALSLLIQGISASSAAGSPQAGSGQQQVAPTETITLESGAEVFPLATTLVGAFQAAHPEVKVNLQLREHQASGEITRLCLLPEEHLQELAGAPWKMSVARDALVPFLNAGNPDLVNLSRDGLTRAEFARLLSRPSGETWAALTAEGNNTGVRVFLPAEERQRYHLASFAGLEVTALKGEIRGSAAEMVAAVRKDPYSIGFCRLSELLDPVTNDFYSGIRPAPIDKNQNGRMDGFEQIFSDKEELMHGIWLGKFPASLSTAVYAAAPARPVAPGEMAFLQWLISDGKQYLATAGLIELSGLQQEMAMEALTPPVIAAENQGDTRSSSWWVLALATLFIAAVIFLPLFLMWRKRGEQLPQELQVSPSLDGTSLTAPAGIFFDRTHTWAFMEKEGLVKLGIDDFIQHITGKLTKVVMKSPGEKIRKGEVAFTLVRDGKQLSLYAPVTGIIRQINTKLERNSSLINTSPFSEGWIYLIEPRNWLKEIKYLLMGEQYRDWLRDEMVRLRDFFALYSRKNSLVYSHIVLQDGGEIADQVLADLGPDVWEEFQTEFINTSR